MNQNTNFDAGPIKNHQALNALLLGLKDLGFGTYNDINGADAIEAIGALFVDVTERILKPAAPVSNESHTLIWENMAGTSSGRTTVNGSKNDATAHWDLYFKPHGFKLVEIERGA